jgi:hypothetical protein
MSSVVSADFAKASYILIYFAVSIGYGIALEWFWRGQTLGKRLMGLRVMDLQALRLQPSQIIIRNLLRAVDVMPALYLVGGAFSLLTARAQRLGDLAANTIVVRTKAAPLPDFDQLATGKYNSLLDYPHIVARLHHRIPPEVAALAADAVIRRAGFTPEARLRLFREIAGYLRSAVEFPPESIDGISDEQIVRNAVEVLYQRRPKGAVA